MGYNWFISKVFYQGANVPISFFVVLNICNTYLCVYIHIPIYNIHTYIYDIIHMHYAYIHLHILYICMYMCIYISIYHIHKHLYSHINRWVRLQGIPRGGEEAARSKCISPRLFFLGMPLVADPGHWHNFAHNIDVRSRKIPPPRHFLREKGWGQNTISLLVRIAPLYYTGAGGGAVKVVCTYKIFVHLHLCKNLFRD